MKLAARHCGRAMTLLEVMLALAILVVLSVGVSAFFFRMTSQRDQLVRLASQQRDVSMLFDRVESALLAAVAVSPDGSAGIKGTETSLTVVARGVQPAFDEGAALADACVVTFEFSEQAARCTQSLAPVGAGGGGGGGSLSEPVLELVERMRFRYSNGRAWSTSYDSRGGGGLPVAVEVSVWFEPRVPRPAPEMEAPGAAGDGMDESAAMDESELGPMDLPPPEPEAPAWAPREPDHVRVIGIPDAPEWQGGES